MPQADQGSPGAASPGNGVSTGGASGGAQDARAWINAWRARSLERALPQDEPVSAAR